MSQITNQQMKKEKWQEQTVVCFFLFEMFACFSINRKKITQERIQET